jgi:hypothetical protein
MREILADLHPATTIVVTIDANDEDDDGGGDEFRRMTEAANEWLLAGLMPDRRGKDCNGGGAANDGAVKDATERALSKHLYAVTGNEERHRRSSPDNAFLLPRHSRCEAFATFSAAGLLVSDTNLLACYLEFTKTSPICIHFTEILNTMLLTPHLSRFR